MILISQVLRLAVLIDLLDNLAILLLILKRSSINSAIRLTSQKLTDGHHLAISRIPLLLDTTGITPKPIASNAAIPKGSYTEGKTST